MRTLGPLAAEGWFGSESKERVEGKNPPRSGGGPTACLDGLQPDHRRAALPVLGANQRRVAPQRIGITYVR
ncbi:hypothetical protein D9M71_155740 [compost metagenome]